MKFFSTMRKFAEWHYIFHAVWIESLQLLSVESVYTDQSMSDLPVGLDVEISMRLRKWRGDLAS